MERRSPPAAWRVYTFTAPHCAACRAMRPDLESVARKYAAEIEVVDVDATHDLELAARMQVRGTPTLVAFVGDDEVFRSSGRRSRAELDLMFSGLLAGEAPSVRSRTDLAVRGLAAVALAVTGVVLSSVALVAVGLGVAAFGMVSWMRS